MKIKDIRAKIYRWTGDVVPPLANFCTNASDVLYERGDVPGLGLMLSNESRESFEVIE